MEGQMNSLDPRIAVALICLDPNKDRPSCTGAPSPLGVLRGVDHVCAVWRPYPDWSNIREIGLHVAFWENCLWNRLTDSKKSLGLKLRKNGWVVRADSVDASAWRDELVLIKEVHGRTVAALEAFDPSLLDQCIGAKTVKTAATHIHGIAMHSLYHAGRMKMIKELYAKTSSCVG
jgi:hypothetical protein